MPLQACLLLDMVFPAVCALTREQKDCHYYCFQGRRRDPAMAGRFERFTVLVMHRVPMCFIFSQGRCFSGSWWLVWKLLFLFQPNGHLPSWGLVCLTGVLLPLHTRSLRPQPVQALVQVGLG